MCVSYFVYDAVQKGTWFWWYGAYYFRKPERTTMQQAIQQQNLLALRKKQYEVKFDLSGTKYDPIENIGTGKSEVIWQSKGNTSMYHS